MKVLRNSRLNNKYYSNFICKISVFAIKHIISNFIISFNMNEAYEQEKGQSQAAKSKQRQWLIGLTRLLAIVWVWRWQLFLWLAETETHSIKEEFDVPKYRDSDYKCNVTLGLIRWKRNWTCLTYYLVKKYTIYW